MTVTREQDKPDKTRTKYIKTLSVKTADSAAASSFHAVRIDRYRRGRGGQEETEKLKVEPLRCALLLLVQDVFL